MREVIENFLGGRDSNTVDRPGSPLDGGATHDKYLPCESVRQRTRFESALSKVADAVIVTDADGLVTYMNPKAEKLTGWPQEEALKEQLDKVFNIVDARARRLWRARYPGQFGKAPSADWPV